MSVDPSPEFHPPMATELTALNPALLRADSEQQQQQQQQQQSSRTLRRFLDQSTQLPQEEIVTRITSEVRQVNKIAKPGS